MLPQKLIRTTDLVNDKTLTTYDLGTFQMATSNFPSNGALIGELWCTYEVELMKPFLEPTTLCSSDYIWNGNDPLVTNVDRAYPMKGVLSGGTAVNTPFVKVGLPNTLSQLEPYNPTLGGSVLYFPRTQTSGYYLLHFCMQKSQSPVGTYIGSSFFARTMSGVVDVNQFTDALLPFDDNMTKVETINTQLLTSETFFVKVTAANAYIVFNLQNQNSIGNVNSFDMAVIYLGNDPYLRPGISSFVAQIERNNRAKPDEEVNLDWLYEREHVHRDSDDDDGDDEKECEPVNSTPVHIELEEKQDGRWLPAGKLDNIAPRTIAALRNHSR
jgi:hypothetical protein